VIQAQQPASAHTPSGSYLAATTSGTTKGNLSWQKTILMGILAGCYIGYGGFLATTVAGNIPGDR
jgi:formate/nitrite transporter FocA (FNT family)